MQIVNKKPFSLEVFADDFEEIEKQARKISQWGENVYVKIPISNSKGKKSISLIKKLSNEGVKLNITAIFTIKQIEETIDALNKNVNSIISNVTTDLAEIASRDRFYNVIKSGSSSKKLIIHLITFPISSSSVL